MDLRPFRVGSLAWVASLTGALFLALSSQGLAQAAPQPIPADVIRSPEINADQDRQIKAYTSYWTDRLTQCQDPDDVQRAREALIKPLQQVNVSVSNVFRSKYSESAVAQLEKALAATNGKSIHCATNAITVISMLGTDRALRPLLDHCDSQFQPSLQIRLRAAAGCATLLPAGTLDARKVVDAAKRLRDMTKDEPSNLVLLRLFEAINAADQGRLEAADRRQIRAMLNDAICIAVDERVAAKPAAADPPVAAVNAAIVLVRDKFTESDVVQSDEKRELSLKLAPRLGKLLDLAKANWEAAQGDEATKRLYGAMIGTCEGFLPILHRATKPPSEAPVTGLKAAWPNADKAKYEADLSLWLNALSQPPYPKP
ncbi:MAG: hypothetical protein L0Y44_08265 [Phycisphaerales bacterium]|nr:hypothetical protein [Phycisphaerales bacterium]